MNSLNLKYKNKNSHEKFTKENGCSHMNWKHQYALVHKAQRVYCLVTGDENRSNPKCKIHCLIIKKRNQNKIGYDQHLMGYESVVNYELLKVNETMTAVRDRYQRDLFNDNLMQN